MRARGAPFDMIGAVKSISSRAVPPSARRILVAELDSLEQASTYLQPRLLDACAGPRLLTIAEAETEIIGAIRLAHLLGDEVLLTDSMLLDSRFFTTVGPRELASRLGLATTDLPITVMCHPEPSIAAAIRYKVARGRAFEWQLKNWFPDGAEWPPPEVATAWQTWIDAATRGDIRLESLLGEPRGAKPPLRIDNARREWSHPAAAAFAEFANGRTHRSEVAQKFKRLASKCRSADERKSLETAWGEWNHAYLDGMARQHGADWVRFRSAAGEAEPETGGRTIVRLSGGLLEQAPAMPPSVFGGLLYAARAERMRFLEKRTPWRLHALAYQVDNAMTGTSWGTAAAGLAARVLLTIAALLLASPLVESEARSLRAAWLLFAVLVVVTLPWSDVGALARLRPRKLGAVLSAAPDEEGWRG